jgi:hypothetical protein
MSLYQVYARASQPEPEAPSVLERLEPHQPAGEVHAVLAGHDQTMCGLSTDSMYAFPMHVWESFTVESGACPACRAAVDQADG